jgi:hypothetical protein
MFNRGLFVLVAFFSVSTCIFAQDERPLPLPKSFDRPLPKIGPGDDELRQLLVKRHEALTAELKACFEVYVAGRALKDDMGELMPRWVASGLEVYDTPKQRLEVLKDYVDLTRTLEQLMDAKFKVGVVGPREALRARAMSFDAQIQHLRLKRQIEKAP